MAGYVYVMINIMYIRNDKHCMYRQGWTRGNQYGRRAEGQRKKGNEGLVASEGPAKASEG